MLPTEYRYEVMARPGNRGPTLGIPEKTDEQLLQDTLQVYAKQGWRVHTILEKSIVLERAVLPAISDEV